MFPSARPVQGGRTQQGQRAQQRQGSGVTGATGSSPLAQSAEPPPEGDPIHSGNMSSGESHGDYNNSGSDSGSRPGTPSGSRPGSPAGDRAAGTSGTESDSDDDSDWENGPDGWGPNDGWNEPTSLLGRAAYTAATIASVPITLGWQLAGAVPLRMKQALVIASLPLMAGSINRGKPVKDTKTPVVGVVKENLDNKTAGLCSGTMLDSTTVLTAAHCVMDLFPYTVTEGEPCPETTDNPETTEEVGTQYDGGDDEAIVEDEDGYGEFVYEDYEGDCGEYNVTMHSTEVADPDRIWVYHGLNTTNTTYIDIEKVIVRQGFDYNDPSTSRNDLAILKAKPGFSFDGLHYPHLLNHREYRKLRKELHQRDKKWQERSKELDKYFTELDKYKKSNGTLPTPATPAPFNYSAPNAMISGWGSYKSDDFLKLEESGQPIPIDMLGNYTHSEDLRKGKIGLRSHGDSNPNVTGEAHQDCSTRLFCQEYIPKSSAACPGDSGGPLFLNKRNPDKTWSIAGVTSRSDCSYGGRFVNLRPHQHWIRRHMTNKPPEPHDTSRDGRPSRPPGESNLVDTTLPSAPASSGAVSRRATTTQASTTTTPAPETTVRFKDTKVKFWKGQGESGPGEPSRSGQEPQGAASDSKGKGFWKGQGQGGTQHRPQHGGHHHGQGAHHREEHGAIDERRSSRGQSSGGHRQPERDQHAGGQLHHREEHGAIDERRSSRGQSSGGYSQPEREQHAGGAPHHREEHGAIDERRSSRGQSHYHHHGGQGSDEPPRLGQGNRSWKGRSSRGDQ